MKLRDKAQRIQEELDWRYPTPPIPLDHSDPYTLLIAVLLSAQCTDKRVNQVTPALFALARTPEAMATHSAEEIREIIKPCGLSPAKSKAIREL
jgi:endonuclease-3